jgi:hypothetical protein
MLVLDLGTDHNSRAQALRSYNNILEHENFPCRETQKYPQIVAWSGLFKSHLLTAFWTALELGVTTTLIKLTLKSLSPQKICSPLSWAPTWSGGIEEHWLKVHQT